MTEENKKPKRTEISESTLMPISLVITLMSLVWMASKVDSRIDNEKIRNDEQDKKIKVVNRIEKRLYKIEVKTGVVAPEPIDD